MPMTSAPAPRSRGQPIPEAPVWARASGELDGDGSAAAGPAAVGDAGAVLGAGVPAFALGTGVVDAGGDAVALCVAVGVVLGLEIAGGFELPGGFELSGGADTGAVGGAALTGGLVGVELAGIGGALGVTLGAGVAVAVGVTVGVRVAVGVGVVVDVCVAVAVGVGVGLGVEVGVAVGVGVGVGVRVATGTRGTRSWPTAVNSPGKVPPLPPSS